MRLTRAAAYAIQAVVHMSQDPQQLFASHDVARAHRIPERFLLKVLKPLVSVGVLHSLRGPNGGYRLARAPKNITVLDIVEAVEGPIRGQVDFPGDNGENRMAPKLEAVLEQNAEETRRRLRKVTISDLAAKK